MILKIIHKIKLKKNTKRKNNLKKKIIKKKCKNKKINKIRMVICDYACMKQWTKYLVYGCSCACIGLGIAKFFNITGALNPIDYIINCYLILLGLIFFTCECEWDRILVHFNFLRYYFGKAFFATL